jgi:hypothetical protein
MIGTFGLMLTSNPEGRRRGEIKNESLVSGSAEKSS